MNRVKRPRVLISQNPSRLLQQIGSVVSTPAFQSRGADDIACYVALAEIQPLIEAKYLEYLRLRSATKALRAEYDALASNARRHMRDIRDDVYVANTDNPVAVGDYGFEVYVTPETSAEGNDTPPPVAE